MRRKDRQKDTSYAMQLLANSLVATLATTNEDNTPYCVPISLVSVNECFYFHCSHKGLKLNNIARTPKVCISAVDKCIPIEESYSMDYSSAIAFGTASIVEDQQEKELALRALCQKYAPSNMEGFPAYLAKYIAATCVVKVTITSITGKAFS